MLYGKNMKLSAKKEKYRSFPENRFRSCADADEMPIQTDVLGSYTGKPEDEDNIPVQDSDDL